MTDKKTLKLNPRLLKIAELLPVCQCMADIGTDHAYIPIYAVLNKKAQSAIASDINRGPLLRAEENSRLFGVSDKVSFRLGSGLCTLSPGEADVIVIAGMGGILIANILEASRPVVSRAKHLILQPMTAAKELREYLCSRDFTIEREVLCAEEDKIYNILCVSVGGKTDYSPKEMLLGRGLESSSPQLYAEYFLGVEKKLKTRLSGLKRSASEESLAAADEVQRQILMINE